MRAVYPGKVVYAAPFEGYGPTVVVQHAGRAFTLYAGLDGGVGGAGRSAIVGQPCSAARATSLYFEIRVDNRPEDPERWLR